jgi:hypothetical protein
MARLKRDWQYDQLRAELAVQRRQLQTTADVVEAPVTEDPDTPIVIPPPVVTPPPVTPPIIIPPVTPPVDPPPANQAPAALTITWRTGFDNGLVPGATALGTVLADLTSFPGTGNIYTEFSDFDNIIVVTGTTLVLSGTPTGTHNFVLKVANTAGSTTQASSISRVVDTPTTGNLAGLRDGSGTVSNIPFLMPTSATTGPRLVSLLDPNSITTNVSANLYRSGFIVYMRAAGSSLVGYDFSGNELWEVIPLADNCSVTDCKFFAGINSPPSTIHSDTVAGTSIDFNEFRGQRSASGNHRQFTAFFGRVHHLSCVRNRVIDTPWDGFLYGGSVALISQNFFQAQGFIDGGHPDLITLNAGYPNQRRTVVSYNWFDALGPENDVRASSSCISIKDNADIRSNYLLIRNMFKGASIQHQMNVDQISRCEFAENYRYVTNGPPIYGTIGAGSNVADDGPYGAFYTEAYTGSHDMMIHDDIEARTGLPAKELDGVTLVARVVSNRPAQPVVTACTASGQVTFAAPANNGSALTRFEFMTSIAGSGTYTDEANMPVVGSVTLTGTTVPIANAWNHIHVRAWNGNGPGPWSKTFEFASATIALSVPSFASAPTIPTSGQSGQTITITINALGNPSPAYTIQPQRDTNGNGIYINFGSTFTTPSYTYVSGDVGNQIRFNVTLTNSQGSASQTTNGTSVITAASATISTTPTVGTFAASALGVGTGTLSCTPGLPAGTGGIVLCGIQYSNVCVPNTGANNITLPSNWIRVPNTNYSFFGAGGLAVYQATVDPVTAPTFSTTDVRAGDFLTAQLFRWTGGASVIVAATAEHYSTSVSLTASGAGNLAVVFTGSEWGAIPGTSSVGTVPAGYTQYSQVAQTDAASYKQNFALDVCNTLTVGAVSVAKAQRTYSPTPSNAVFAFLLLR